MQQMFQGERVALTARQREQREHEALVAEAAERNQVLRRERRAVRVKSITDL